MRMAGVLGGMGPGTTADFYSNINALAESQQRTERPEIMIYNVPLNYELESRLLTERRGIKDYLPYLQEGATRLLAAGSEFLVMPCNTVHELYPELSESIRVPFLHIIEETVGRLKDDGVEDVGLLATGQTISSRIYQHPLIKENIAFHIPREDDQRKIDNIVDSLVDAEGAARARDGSTEARRWFNDLVKRLIRNHGAVVLGCTDFHILLDDQEPGLTYDSMKILAEATVKEIYRPAE